MGTHRCSKIVKKKYIFLLLNVLNIGIRDSFYKNVSDLEKGVLFGDFRW